MTDIVDLAGLVAQPHRPNLVTDFADQAKTLLDAEHQDWDGCLINSDGHYAFMLQYASGDLVGALVMSISDAVAFGQRMSELEAAEAPSDG